MTSRSRAEPPTAEATSAAAAKAPDPCVLKTPADAAPTRRRRAGLHDALLTQLRDMLIAGELAPGSRIPERALCERFAVSRTPLREALKVLASEGYIELLPNRGARVATLSAEEIRHTFDVMAALEALAGQLAASRVQDDELAELRALHYQMYAHYLRGETAEYYRLNQLIHERIVAAARNPVLSLQYGALQGRVSRQRYRAHMSQSRWDQAMAEHEEMLNALSQRNAAALSGILARHLENKLDLVLEQMGAAEEDVRGSEGRGDAAGMNRGEPAKPVRSDSGKHDSGKIVPLPTRL